MSETAKPAEPTHYVPKSQVDPEVLMKAFQEEGIVEPAPAPAAQAATPAVKEEPKAPAAEPPSEPTLVRLAREKAEARRAEQEKRPSADLNEVFTPQEVARLIQAKKSGDPVAWRQAGGFDHVQYNKAVLGMKDEEKPKEEPKVNSEIETYKARLERLEAEREAERLQAGMGQFKSQAERVVKDDPKFVYVNAVGNMDGIVNIINDFYHKFGELPGKTPEENIKIAAEAYESFLRSGDAAFTKKQWERINSLTAAAGSVPVQSKAPAQPPSAGTDSTRTLTNSNTSAPAAVKTVPKTRAERLQALMEGREAELE